MKKELSGLYRYKIRLTESGQHEAYDSVNDVAVMPGCEMDMAAFNAYLTGRGLHQQSQDFLASIVNKEFPISNMQINVQRAVKLPMRKHAGVLV